MFEIHGYPLESHQVLTEDGYTLTLLRIARGIVTSAAVTESEEVLSKVPEPTRPAVLLVPGLACRADLWFVNSPEKALPYMLSDSGHDVFVAYIRGTHSKSIQTDSRKYWDFSFDEIGRFDVPAMINYILKITGLEKIFYIGHSLSCTAVFITMSLKPEYCSKVHLIVALAPAGYLKNIRNTICRTIVLPLGFLVGQFRNLYRKETLTDSILDSAKKFCPPFNCPENLAVWILKTIGSWLGNFGKDQIEKYRLPAVAALYPTSTSMKVLAHGGQCYMADKLQHYDYGQIGNMERYGQSSPPVYNLKNIDVPVVTFYSEGDHLCTRTDVTRLAEELPNVIGNYGIREPQFGHNDFLVGKDAAELVYTQIIRVFQSSYKESLP